MKHFDAPHACPWCGRAQDAVSPTNGEDPPEAGAVSVCIDCVGVGLFTDKGSLRRPTSIEMIQLLQDDDVARTVAMIRDVNALLGRSKS